MLQCAKAGIRMYLYAIVNYSKSAKPIAVDRQLPPVRDAIDYAHAMAAIAPMIDSRLKRLVEARMVADLSIDVVNHKQITAVAEPVKNYTTATVRAAQLGYSVKQIDSGTDLGKFVKKQIAPEFQDWQGQYKVNHFEVNDQLDSCIHAYFLTRSL